MESNTRRDFCLNGSNDKNNKNNRAVMKNNVIPSGF
jgi:hypothetical protein